ncbi:MAG: DNA polymerase [Thermoguttaceae bacterium]
MTPRALDPFAHVWLCDFEYRQPEGCQPEVHCMVARERRTGETIRAWGDDLARMTQPPFAIGPEAVFVAFYASAEMNCFLALGWPLPARILDLFVEFRCLTNGLAVPCGNGILGALAYHGIDGIDVAEKESMRELAMRGGPFTSGERAALLAYCETDVVALEKLLPAMLPQIDLPRALLRGRYMAAAARMEWAGVPIDVETLDRLKTHWTQIQGRLIAAIDVDYGVYVPTGQSINAGSTRGAELLRVAENRGVDPYRLAEVADVVWSEERVGHAEQRAALAVARKATGLTARRIADWENSGKDCATWPGLDVTARELAGQYPALGIGRGFEEGSGYDGFDYAGQLWELLRGGARPIVPRHDPQVLARAADLAASAGPCCDSQRLSFNAQRWAEYLARNGIPWPRLESGALDLSDETFRQMARQYPQVAPIRELRHTLGQLRLNALAVGADGRNRCLLSAFQARTGRNQPSNSRYIFGPSCWLRGLIKPERGRAVAYVDWSQQEFGIAAALSGDGAMMEAYSSGDPYLTFAKQAGAVPADATKQSHPRERGQFKVCALAVQYRMGARSLSQAIGQPEVVGRELLCLHQQTYPRYWAWSEAAVNHAMLRGWLQTVFGWRIQVGPDCNPRSLANFPMQANGADMLRLACCLATERGIAVCAPVHDALLVEGPAEMIEIVVAETQAAMAEAARITLNGFELRSDAKIIRWPERYMDDRGTIMWDAIMGILAELDRDTPQTDVSHFDPFTCGQNGPPVQSYVF